MSDNKCNECGSTGKVYECNWVTHNKLEPESPDHQDCPLCLGRSKKTKCTNCNGKGKI
ncbi:MAG: hypothetical protein OEV44_05170 [Spirochaetota bacterium]|nr:hypothetical protein [Spirochaetota bacterium]